MEKKVYTKKSEKVVDFFIGFVGVPTFFAAILWGYSFLRYKQAILFDKSVVIFVFLKLIGYVFYLVRKRKYVAIGLIYFLVVAPLVFVGTCFALIIGISRSH
jgi:hypothetical protein